MVTYTKITEGNFIIYFLISIIKNIKNVFKYSLKQQESHEGPASLT